MSEADWDRRSLIVDIHGYDATTALLVVDTKIREASRAGVELVRILHGFPNVRFFKDDLALQQVKWAMKTMQEKGPWAAIVERIELGENSSAIYLRKPEEQSQPVRSRRYTRQQARRDAEAVVDAIVSRRPHPAVRRRRGRSVVTLSRSVPDVHSVTASTLDGRRRRLRAAIRELMQQHPEYREVRHGSKLAYEHRSAAGG